MSDKVRALREEIGRRHGMSTALAALLVGEAEADIEADVRAFLQAVGAEGPERVVSDPARVSAEMRRRREARATRERIEREREGDAAMREAGWDE